LGLSNWVEWNNDGIEKCYINQLCNIKLTLKDKYGNIVTTPNLFVSNDLDAFSVGPQNTTKRNTTYIRTLDTSMSA
jgi:hypothetical protein